MKNDVVQVQIRGILPANSGCALFVGNDEKVFVINVEPNMGSVIGMYTYLLKFASGLETIPYTVQRLGALKDILRRAERAN